MIFERALIAIPGILTPAAFSGERIFEIQLANGQSYTGIAPRYFCWNSAGKLVSENEPSVESAGMIAAKLIEEMDDDQIAVEVPDGKMIAVDKNNIKPRPTPIFPPSRTTSSSR